eukprot:351740-Chlamydomonas_euryale.AAC.2
MAWRVVKPSAVCLSHQIPALSAAALALPRGQLLISLRCERCGSRKDDPAGCTGPCPVAIDRRRVSRIARVPSDPLWKYPGSPRCAWTARPAAFEGRWVAQALPLLRMGIGVTQPAAAETPPHRTAAPQASEGAFATSIPAVTFRYPIRRPVSILRYLMFAVWCYLPRSAGCMMAETHHQRRCMPRCAHARVYMWGRVQTALSGTSLSAARCVFACSRSPGHLEEADARVRGVRPDCLPDESRKERVRVRTVALLWQRLSAVWRSLLRGGVRRRNVAGARPPLSSPPPRRAGVYAVARGRTR